MATLKLPMVSAIQGAVFSLTIQSYTKLKRENRSGPDAADQLSTKIASTAYSWHAGTLKYNHEMQCVSHSITLKAEKESL